jgi:hypothetical protein
VYNGSFKGNHYNKSQVLKASLCFAYHTVNCFWWSSTEGESSGTPRSRRRRDRNEAYGALGGRYPHSQDGKGFTTVRGLCILHHGMREYEHRGEVTWYRCNTARFICLRCVSAPDPGFAGCDITWSPQDAVSSSGRKVDEPWMGKMKQWTKDMSYGVAAAAMASSGLKGVCFYCERPYPFDTPRHVWQDSPFRESMGVTRRR